MLYRSLTGLVVAVGALGACRSDRPAEEAAATPAPPAPAQAPTIPSHTFTATDYTFSGPTDIAAGTSTFRLVNRGKEPHHVVLVRLDEGKTFADLQTALQNPGPPPAWAKAIGGPNAVDASGESNATLTLNPGQYALLCFIPSVDGVPHFAKGMMSAFEVVPALAAGAPEPTPDAVMKLLDYDFTLSAPLKAGKQTIRVENSGPQEHEVVIARFAEGKTLKDFGAWVEGGFKTAPPATFIGGASPMAPGEHNLITLDLPPGEYALLCFVPDAKDHKEHLQHGMAKQVTVS